MKYYLIRKWGGVWEHLYPERNGEKPINYTFREAEQRKQRLEKLSGQPFRIIPESDFDKYEVPERW